MQKYHITLLQPVGAEANHAYDPGYRDLYIVVWLAEIVYSRNTEGYRLASDWPIVGCIQLCSSALLMSALLVIQPEHNSTECCTSAQHASTQLKLGCGHFFNTECTSIRR